MKSVSINGIARVNLGKPFAKQLRKEDNVPCVIYGGTDEPIHFYAHENEFRKIIYTPDVFLVDVVIGDETISTTMRDIQFHPVTDRVLHIDFLRVIQGKKVQINIPVNVTGNSVGVRNGGRLAVNMRKIMVEAFSDKLPEVIELDITNVRIGESIRISDLAIDDVTFLNNANDVVVAVKTARAAILDEELEEESDDATGDTSDDATGDTSPTEEQASKEE